MNRKKKENDKNDKRLRERNSKKGDQHDEKLDAEEAKAASPVAISIAGEEDPGSALEAFIATQKSTEG